MSNYLAEGIWPCTVIGGEAGEQDGIIKARVNVKIDDGPSAGRFCTYEDDINAKSSLYVFRSLKACGWKGVDLADVKKDIAEWVEATGGKTTVEVKHLEMKKGKKIEKWEASGKVGPRPIWDKVNALGRGLAPLAAPKGDALKDANEAMKRAMQEDGFAPDDFGSAPSGEQVRSDDDIPLATSSMSASLGEIAAVLK